MIKSQGRTLSQRKHGVAGPSTEQGSVRAQFPTDAYSGYFMPDNLREDEVLTHVERKTPGGEYLRRFWHPIALSSELTDLPLPCRVLGENLVLFRTTKGKIGLLHRHCSHRGASLEYGRVTEKGVQCCYHGWHYAVDGKLVEAPGEPENVEKHLKTTVCQGAYPTQEYRGLIFAYLGPPDEQPAFPYLDTLEEAGTTYAAMCHHFPCNWLQIHENCMDPYHATWLHGKHAEIQLTAAFAEDPVLEWRHTPIGMTCASTRRVGDNLWITQVDAVLPNLRQTGFWEDGMSPKAFARSALTVWITPIDNENSFMIGFRCFNDKVDPNHQGRVELCGKESSDVPGQDGNRPYEEQQRNPSDWEANSSQRRIAQHALERPGSTDRGVHLFRKMLRREIENLEAGKKIICAAPNEHGVIPTYVQDSVLRVPAKQGTDDIEVKKSIGKAVVDIVLDPDIAMRKGRYTIVEEMINSVPAKLALI